MLTVAVVKVAMHVTVRAGGLTHWEIGLGTFAIEAVSVEQSCWCHFAGSLTPLYYHGIMSE